MKDVYCTESERICREIFRIKEESEESMPTVFEMSDDDIQQMIDNTVMRCNLWNKPRFVEVITCKWVRTADHQHDTVSSKRGYGVLYNNGAPMNKRERFNDIRREMRKYEIYC